MQFAHFEFDPETDRLGEGPLSEVYRAKDMDLGGRLVALKILRAHAEIDPQADTRFHREAVHTSNLDHPNIATIYEYRQYEGTSYIAMEYLQGQTLDKIIKNQTLGYEECQRIASAVTSALALVHSKGLVHRDLKPGNIMVMDDGTVKLLDFGIARASDEATITQHGMLVGTVLYMSPEQVRGEDIDARSDVFSLGSVLYHVATGQLAFPGSSFPEVCMAILDGNPRRPSLVRQGFPQPLEDFVLKCLENDPAARFPDGETAHGALMALGSSLSATNGVAPSSTIKGTIVMPPLRCGGEDIAQCSILAGSLRKDLATELGRNKSLSVELTDTDDLSAGNPFDYVLRGELAIDGPHGTLDLQVEHYNRAAGNGQVLATREGSLSAEDANEWTLQATLVRNAVRTVRKFLSELTLKPSKSVQRDTEKALQLAARARDVLHRGTSKHLMSAVSTFRRAMDADPYCPAAYAGMAEAMVRKYLYWDGDTTFIEEARDFASRALALDPSCGQAHTALGFGNHLSGHPTDAQREYRTAIQLDKEEWLAHRLLGGLLVREGNFAEASALLMRAIALKPIHIGSYDHRFNVLQRLGRDDESYELADRGISKAKAHLKEVPDNQEARTHMAMLLARIGLVDEAREQALKAHQLSPKDGYTSYHVACTFSLIGDIEEAVETLAQAIARGFFIKSELLQNTDLDVLRGLPEFQTLVT